MRITSALCVLGLVGIPACGGSSKQDGPDTGGSSTQGGSGSAGTPSGGGQAASAGQPDEGGSGHVGGSSGGGAMSRCPDQPPADGSACVTQAGGNGLFGSAADCSWGDDIRPRCRTLGVCQQDKWSITLPDAGCDTPPLPAACPAAPADVSSECAEAGLECWYEDGTLCSCSPCQGGSEYPICQTIDPPQWACVEPMAGCPNPPPQAGDACSDPELQCGTSCELPLRCEEGAWQYGQEMCPICASPDTPIATPSGERAIAELRPGDLVYSLEPTGIVTVPVALVGSTPVVAHQVMRIALDSGASLEISPNHPTAAGAPLASLAAGSKLDATHTITSIELVPYRHSRTYDILPSSSSGVYFAGGAALGSTLVRH